MPRAKPLTAEQEAECRLLDGFLIRCLSEVERALDVARWAYAKHGLSHHRGAIEYWKHAQGYIHRQLALTHAYVRARHSEE